MMDLIERLSAATGPDRRLDAEIAAVVGAEHGSREYVRIGTRSIEYHDEICPFYTASIDAALTLVPKDTVWHLMTDYGDLNRAKIGPVGNVRATIYRCNGAPPDLFTQADGNTPATALCIAALRARTENPHA